MAKRSRCKCGGRVIVLMGGTPLCEDCFGARIATQVKATREAWEAKGWDPKAGFVAAPPIIIERPRPEPVKAKRGQGELF